ncbi:hypothetical protein NUU61_002082 [Penicillium alfredii]|uniref:Uncharacterized protein n=1 Tax=Penicillium alfredii TaxID=1506179 RepID=A0A9W9FRN4_9EURO|nr:uncharacterized protein NUU61_002082 [Penicillium alfredii]KAJ5104735.1 hypothetical protein NUU61_002082 [Penicillium alfredii]
MNLPTLEFPLQPSTLTVKPSSTPTLVYLILYPRRRLGSILWSSPNLTGVPSTTTSILMIFIITLQMPKTPLLQIRHYLTILYTHYEKECEGDIEFLNEVTGWDEIKHDNPFHHSPKGLLLGCGPLSWDSKSKREWCLKLRVSPIYSFLRKAEAPFNLFVRYFACEPRDGPEYEFYNDGEATPTHAPEYVTSSPEINKVSIPRKMMPCLLKNRGSTFLHVDAIDSTGRTDEEFAFHLRQRQL